MDGPARRQEGQVLSAADSHFEPAHWAPFPADDMAEDLHPGLANSALDHQEGLFPRRNLTQPGPS